MRESFVFHSEYLEDLPEEYKSQFLMYIYNYGIHNEIPNLEGLEKTIWIKIQRRIDSDIEQWENTKKARSDAGKKHTGNQYTNKSNNEHLNSNLEQNGTDWNKMEQNGTNGTVSVYVNDTVNVNEYGVVNEDVAEVTTTRNHYATQYSKKIFEIFREAGFPCAKNNEISFLQTDFKNAMAFLHGSSEFSNIHSDDVIQACRNYVRLYQDQRTYIKHTINFYSLVKSKLFYGLLPQNFDLANYYDNSKKDIPKLESENIIFQVCPECNTLNFFWNNEKQMYCCKNCGAIKSFDEVHKLEGTG